MPISPSQFSELKMYDLKVGLPDMVKTGYGFGGGAGFEVTPTVEIVGWVEYYSFSFDEDGFGQAFDEEFARLIPVPGLEITSTLEGDAVSILEVTGNVKLNIPVGGPEGKLRPYLYGGAGVGSVKIPDASMSVHLQYLTEDTTIAGPILEETTETKFAFAVGGGFQYWASPKVGVFAEVKYTQVAVTGDPIGYLPIRGGICFNLGE